MIGVITPLYNTESRIKYALDSVQKQKVACTHYIYDDASTDASKAIVNEYFGQRDLNHKISLYNGSVRSGQSNGRNTLIKLAIQDDCDLIAFLDADDMWDDDHLMEHVSFRAKAHDVTYTLPKLTDGIQEVFPWGIPAPKTFIGKQLENNNFIWTSGVVASAKCFIHNDFDSKLDSIEDWDMWYRLFKDGHSFAHINKKTFTYFVAPGGSAGQAGDKLQLLREKNKFKMKGLKLNIGCGADYKSKYINLDIKSTAGVRVDCPCDIRNIPYENNCIDEILVSHVLEYFDFQESTRVLAECCRVLKSGGKIQLEVHDFLALSKSFVNSDDNGKVQLYSQLFGCPWEDGLFHKFMFTENQLMANLSWAGFKGMKRIPPFSKQANIENQHLYLAMEAFK